jgi:mono/diheme cytochrome c family protein
MPTPLPPEVELTAGELRVRGRQVYSRHCAVCHDEEFAGSLSNSLSRFANASALFGYMRDAMPQGNPGSLKLDEYMAVLAKVLVEEGVVAEDSVLDPNSLDTITFR